MIYMAFILGTPIFKLDKKTMGCVLPVWAIITIVLLGVGIVIIVIILHRKWETIKFFVYFNVLPNDDEPENLDEMDFDAFVTCR